MILLLFFKCLYEELFQSIKIFPFSCYQLFCFCLDHLFKKNDNSLLVNLFKVLIFLVAFQVYFLFLRKYILLGFIFAIFMILWLWYRLFLLSLIGQEIDFVHIRWWLLYGHLISFILIGGWVQSWVNLLFHWGEMSSYSECISWGLCYYYTIICKFGKLPRFLKIFFDIFQRWFDGQIM